SGGNMGNYTYAWSDNLGNAYPSSQNITVSPINTLTFKVIVDDGYNSTEGTMELIVYPSAAFSWQGGLDLVHACPSDSVILKPDPQVPGWSYLWSNGSVQDQITVATTGIGFSLQTYTLTISSADGCSFSNSATVIFDFSYCSGIDDIFPDNFIKITPNPGIGLFKAEIMGKNDFEILSVFNNLSGKVLEKNIAGNTDIIDIDLTQQPQGLYLVRLTGDCSVAYCKILISR
ncbi:MAG: T9SS type A sorting domain-containing protein, partial [Bacteroidales bacterium]|nr:T9SS type A sorting domain-containing protein [Bacteroidales bacterium]